VGVHGFAGEYDKVRTVQFAEGDVLHVSAGVGDQVAVRGFEQVVEPLTQPEDRACPDPVFLRPRESPGGA
jgi:hypothetical protein